MAETDPVHLSSLRHWGIRTRIHDVLQLAPRRPCARMTYSAGLTVGRGLKSPASLFTARTAMHRSTSAFGHIAQLISRSPWRMVEKSVYARSHLPSYQLHKI